MSNQTDHTIVRLRVPPDLKKQIEDSAERNNRSQSAEMVARLEESFSGDYPEIIKTIEESNQRLEKAVQVINKLLEKIEYLEANKPTD